MQDEPPVGLVHLLEEDEREHGVRPDAGVIRREALPEREDALVAHHLGENVQASLVLGHAVNDLHVLNPASEEIDESAGQNRHLWDTAY